MEEPPILHMDDDMEVRHIIAVLNATPGCSSAGQSKYNGPTLNRMDVHVNVDDGSAISRS